MGYPLQEGDALADLQLGLITGESYTIHLQASKPVTEFLTEIERLRLVDHVHNNLSFAGDHFSNAIHDHLDALAEQESRISDRAVAVPRVALAWEQRTPSY